MDSSANSSPVLTPRTGQQPTAMPAMRSATAPAPGHTIASTTRAKAGFQHGITTIMLTEDEGLPADEAYHHLALLRRYVLHGPTLGLPTRERLAAPPMRAEAGHIPPPHRQP
jgi:hypothetical protein